MKYSILFALIFVLLWYFTSKIVFEELDRLIIRKIKKKGNVENERKS